jgi:phage terminase Nu1 subunit (DNA packaging protein)
VAAKKQRRHAVDLDRSISADELAELLELTPARIRQLVQEGILERAGHGRYALAANIRAYLRHLRAGNGTGRPGEAESPKLRRDRAEAERAELRVDREREELIPRAAALDMLNGILGALGSVLLKIPTSWSVDVVNIKGRRDAVVRLRPLVAQLIEKLALVADEIDPDTNGTGRR